MSDKNKTIEWDSSEGVQKIADFLRGRKGMSVRNAVELGKRVEYFKGDKLASFLMENHKKCSICPVISDRNDAIKIGNALVRNGFIHRSERDPEKKKVLEPSTNHAFVLDGYYTWMYEGRKTLKNILTTLLIFGFLACTCYPIWPRWSKVVVWYMSVTFLIFLIVFSTVRLFSFFILWMIGIECWFLPNIFDDNLSVVDSFKPLYSWKKTDVKERYYRLAAIIGTVLISIWIHNQPTDFDEYLTITKQFTDDIYSGKLLAEFSQKQKENIDSIYVPDLKSLLKEEAEEDQEKSATNDNDNNKEKDDNENDITSEELKEEALFNKINNDVENENIIELDNEMDN